MATQPKPDGTEGAAAPGMNPELRRSIDGDYDDSQGGSTASEDVSVPPEGDRSAWPMIWAVVTILMILLSIYLLPRVFRLPPRLRNGLILAGAVYLMGSIGMEMVGGAYREGNPIKDPTYWFITTVEETLEISGLLILISVLLRNLRESLHVTDVSVGVLIDPRPQPDPRAPVRLDAHGIAASSRAG